MLLPITTAECKVLSGHLEKQKKHGLSSQVNLASNLRSWSWLSDLISVSLSCLFISLGTVITRTHVPSGGSPRILWPWSLGTYTVVSVALPQELHAPAPWTGLGACSGHRKGTGVIDTSSKSQRRRPPPHFFLNSYCHVKTSLDRAGGKRKAEGEKQSPPDCNQPRPASPGHGPVDHSQPHSHPVDS